MLWPHAAYGDLSFRELLVVQKMIILVLGGDKNERFFSVGNHVEDIDIESLANNSDLVGTLDQDKPLGFPVVLDLASLGRCGS